jgi:hypothetical protein
MVVLLVKHSGLSVQFLFLGKIWEEIELSGLCVS